MKSYKLGRTKEERQKTFEEIVNLYKNENLSLNDIGKRYNVSKQAISLFLNKKGFVPYKEVDMKNLHYKKIFETSLTEEKIKDFERRIYNSKCLSTQYRIKNKKLKQSIYEIFACIIRANKENKITDTIWYNKFMTLYDFMAYVLEINGDQNEIEAQIMKRIK